jgi:hypothetical protein
VSKQDAPDTPESTEPTEAEKEEVRKAVDFGQKVANLPPFYEQQKKEREQKIVLKGRYAYALLALLAAQIAVVDFVLVAYAWKGVSWRVEPLVVNVWLSATVVEVIAVVYVVTRHLFPYRGEEEDEG